jgi:hypothetical protein
MPPRPITRCQAITDIIESVAQEQAALGCILSAECENLEKIVSCACSPCELYKANKSVNRLMNSVVRLEMILQSKLELFEDCLCFCDSHHKDDEKE